MSASPASGRSWSRPGRRTVRFSRTSLDACRHSPSRGSRSAVSSASIRPRPHALLARAPYGSPRPVHRERRSDGRPPDGCGHPLIWRGCAGPPSSTATRASMLGADHTCSLRVDGDTRQNRRDHPGGRRLVGADVACAGCSHGGAARPRSDRAPRRRGCAHRGTPGRQHVRGPLLPGLPGTSGRDGRHARAGGGLRRTG